MDIILANTLDANPNTRLVAERELREFAKQNDALFKFLELTCTDYYSQIGVKKCSLIFMKNNFEELWMHTNDKRLFKHKIIDCMLKTTDESLLSLFCKVLKELLRVDDDNWDGLVETISEIVNSNNPSSIYIGLLCLIEVLKYYKSNRQNHQVDQIVRGCFPKLFIIASSLIQQSEHLAGYIIWKILKVYKITISIDLFPTLREKNEIERWSSLFLELIVKKEQSWQKTRKWSMKIINQLFLFYTVSHERHFVFKYYSDFASVYLTTILPEVNKQYLLIVDNMTSGNVVLSDKDIQELIRFFMLCVPIDSFWDVMYHHLENILSTLIFGSMRLTENDLDDFDNSPQEYLANQCVNLDYDDYISAHNAAMFLLESLIRHRRNTVFSGILYFVDQIMQKHTTNPSDLQLALDKDCALFILCDISNEVLSQRKELDGFINAYVVSDFNTRGLSHGFLRARLCQFISLYYKSLVLSTLSQAYKFVVESLNITPDNSTEQVPTKIFAADALMKLLQFDQFQQIHSGYVTNTVQKLLPLYGLVDADFLSEAMQNLVSIFPAELLPYSVQLCDQLCDQLTRQSDSPHGIIQTLTSILMTLEEYPEQIMLVQKKCLPIFEVILSHPEVDCQAEMFELVTIFITSVKKVTPTMWSVFELLHENFLTDPLLYLEDMLPCLNEFAYYGMDKLCHTPKYIDSMFDVINYVLSEDSQSLGYCDEFAKTSVVNTCLLISTRCPPGCLDSVLPKLLKNLDPHSPYKMHHLYVLVGTVFYSPQLIPQNTLNAFLDLWLTTIESGQLEEHCDKKLSIAALLNLIRTVPSLAQFDKLGRCLAKLLEQCMNENHDSLSPPTPPQNFTFVDESNVQLSNGLTQEEFQFMPLTEAALNSMEIISLYSEVMNWLKVVDAQNYDRYANDLTNNQRQIHFSLI